MGYIMELKNKNKKNMVSQLRIFVNKVLKRGHVLQKKIKTRNLRLTFTNDNIRQCIQNTNLIITFLICAYRTLHLTRKVSMIKRTDAIKKI